MEKGKVIVCYPVVTGNGAKYTATNLAMAYKEKFKSAEVALVDFDFKNPYLAYSFTEHDKVHGIDNLIDKIDADSLTKELFKENMVRVHDVDILKGTKLIGRGHLLTKNHIISIIDFLEELYDYVIIAVSSEADNSGTVYALSEADEILLIINNNLTNFMKLPQAVNIIDNYKSTREDPKIIYNMYMNNARVGFNQLFDEYYLKVIGIVPPIPETIDNNNFAGVNSKIAIGGKGKNDVSTYYEEIVMALDPDIEIG